MKPASAILAYILCCSSLLPVSLALDPWQIYDKLEERYRVRCVEPYTGSCETITVSTNWTIPPVDLRISTNEEDVALLFTTNLLVLQGPVANIRTATGILRHYPSDVRTAEAWYGHNFMVDGIPIQPTEIIPEATLLQHVGKRIRVTGPWNPGTVWKPGPDEMTDQMPCDPDDDIPDIVNDGIMANSIDPL